MQIEPRYKETLVDVLVKVMLANPYAETTVIAGGCVRDHLFGTLIKDIDVFVRSDRNSEDLLLELQEVFPTARMEYDLSYSGNPEVAAVFDLGWRAAGCLPVQVIQLRRGETAEDMVSRIDIGLCQVGLKLTGLITTEAFLKDVENKTMTVVNCESERALDRSQRRYERLSEKYAGYTFVPPVNRPWEGLTASVADFDSTGSDLF